ncbi:MAG TPA: copper oxidase [Gammaproteobacteria bacterium]|jgi:bilirubin oxidase|nr:copper oxidase [Gammaproteobacteria bacterium]
MITRRQFFHSIAVAAALPKTLIYAAKKTLFQNEFKVPPIEIGKRQGKDVYFDLNIQSGYSQILPEVSTRTLGINQAFLGTTLRAKKGDRVHINVSNSLSRTTTLHWHGVKLPAKADGGPHQPIHPGKTWLSEYEIFQPAATLWYHAHQMHETGEQVYNGLAGMFIIDDDESKELGLPSEYGIDDFPVIIQDKEINDDGSFEYIGRFDVQAGMMGKMGETILVNGITNSLLSAQKSLIRLRILNGSNARIYNLQFDDNRSFQIIASDGGLLEKPVSVNNITIAPAERIEIVVDVSDGAKPTLIHSAQMDGMSNMNSSEMGFFETIAMSIFADDEPPKNYNIFQIDASKSVPSSATVPDKLSTHQDISQEPIVEHRTMVLKMEDGSPFTVIAAGIFGSKDLMTINDKSMDINRIDEVVKAGTVEVWKIVNDSMMAHPFHIHNVQFKVLNKMHGIKGHELGYKDVVLVQPGETLEVIMKFPDFSDDRTPYMYHCHILEHEDRGMMGQFVVV